MSYIMYVCPDCRKVFKINGNGKKAKCPKCQESILVDMNETEDAWKSYDQAKRQNIISDFLDEPEIIEVEEPIEEQPTIANKKEPSAVKNSEQSVNTRSSFFDFDELSPKSSPTSSADSLFQNNIEIQKPVSQPVYTQDVSSQNEKHSTLSIVALIFSIIGCLSLIGLILAIIDLAKNKDDGQKHILSKISLGIVGLYFVVGFFIGIAGVGRSSQTSTAEKNSNVSISSAAESEDQETPGQSDDSSNTDSSEAEDLGIEIDPNATVSEINALRSAIGYISHSSFSYEELIEQLEYEGYSHADAEYAVSKLNIDWNEQALKQAKSYLSNSAFSHDELIGQLEYSKFTTEQATYAVDNCGADWDEQALKQAKSYLSNSAFSHDELIEQLEYSKFTTEQATYAVDNCGADWDEQALKQAKSYLSNSAFSYKELKEQLEYSKYTSEQAAYAVDNCGADWNEQAVKKAESYLSHSSFSRSELIEQLEYSGFTHEQAVHGVDSTGL